MQLLPLIEHHAERAYRGARYNALGNCHAHGMDSIVLHDEPGNRVRMFIANAGHTLWRNRDNVLSIAIHPHHCDVRLVGLYGEASNEVYAITPNQHGCFSEMIYRSGITSGEPPSLSRTGNYADVHRIRTEPLFEGALLRAADLHTIFVEQDETAAWLVIEGAEDQHYRSRCWTNDLRPDLSGLYTPMDQRDVAAALSMVAYRMRSIL